MNDRRTVRAPRHRPTTATDRSRDDGHPRARAEETDVNTTPEARKSFHEALEELRADVIRLGALTTEAIGGATQSMLDADLSL